jgi:3-dehydroquinate synthase
MLLNFGHTIGHALESWFLETDQPLTHGEAVYIGMICEAHFLSSVAAPSLDEPEGQTKASDLQNEVMTLGLHVFTHRMIPTTAFPELWTLMQQDKKNLSGTVRMTVPDKGPFSMKIIVPTQSDLERSLQYFNALK